MLVFILVTKHLRIYFVYNILKNVLYVQTSSSSWNGSTLSDQAKG